MTKIIFIFFFILISFNVICSVDKKRKREIEFLNSLPFLHFDEKYFEDQNVRNREKMIKDLAKEFRDKLKKKNDGDKKVPLMIIPSLFGSKILAKLNKESSAHWWCSKHTSDYFVLWIDLLEIIPIKAECMVENMKMVYENQTIFNSQGVKTKVYPPETSLDGIEYIDREKTIGIWNEVVKLFTEIGYEKGKNLRGFAYDFRMAPFIHKPKSKDELSVWNEYELLKKWIENTYEVNEKQKVAFVSLSMGGTYFNIFLNNYVSEEWKKQYIHSFTSFDSPYSGSGSILQFLFTNPKHYDGKPLPAGVKELITNLPSLLWMFPNDIFGDKVIVQTPSKNYTAKPNDVISFFQRIFDEKKAESIKNVYLDNLPYRQYRNPNITYHSVHSYNLSTITGVKFLTDDISHAEEKDIKFIYEDGDETVPLFGLKIPDQWAKSDPNVHIYSFPNVVHGDGTKNKNYLRVLLENVLEISSSNSKKFQMKKN